MFHQIRPGDPTLANSTQRHKESASCVAAWGSARELAEMVHCSRHNHRTRVTRAHLLKVIGGDGQAINDKLGPILIIYLLRYILQSDPFRALVMLHCYAAGFCGDPE